MIWSTINDWLANSYLSQKISKKHQDPSLSSKDSVQNKKLSDKEKDDRLKEYSEYLAKNLYKIAKTNKRKIRMSKIKNLFD